MVDKSLSFGEQADKALRAIEEKISVLDTKWRLFFLGSKDQRYPPEEETERLAREIRQVPTKNIFRARHQFMYGNLGYRFNMHRQRWDRYMRILEERGRRGVLDAMGLRNPKLQRLADKADSRRGGPPKPTSLPNDYFKVFQAFKAALAQSGNSKKLNQDRFMKELKRQEILIRKKIGDKPLEFSVKIVDGKPKIKARVIKKSPSKRA